MRDKELDFLSDLHAHSEGCDAQFCAQWYHKNRYERMLRQGLIREEERRCLITPKGREHLDASKALLPCAFKDLLFEHCPQGVDPQKWRRHIQIHLDEESNITNVREFLPCPELRLRTGVMESSPEEVAIFVEGQLPDGSYVSEIPMVMLSPHYDSSAQISKDLADLFLRERTALAASLAGPSPAAPAV